MQQTGYDVSAAVDPAVTRKILLDGLRRPAVEVRPFAPREDPVAEDPRDLILVDLEREHDHGDLLAALRAAAAMRVAGAGRRETD